MSGELLDSIEADPEPKRDRWGRPLIPDPDTGKETAYTRVTTFAKSISDTFGLAKWQTRQAVKGLTMRADLFALAAATPVDDSKTLDRVAEDAKQAAGSSAGANAGTALHSFTERVDRGEDIVVPAPWDADVAAYRRALAAGGFEVDRRYIERMVIIPEMGCAGTFDRLLIRIVDGQLVVGDVKSQKDMTFGHLEISIQLALYSRGRSIWNTRTREHEPMPAVDQTTAIVMHTPVGKATCRLYVVDLVAGWQAAQLCTAVRGWRARKDLVTPLSVAAPSVLEQVQHASNRADLERLWQTHESLWTPDLSAAATARLAQL